MVVPFFTLPRLHFSSLSVSSCHLQFSINLRVNSGLSPASSLPNGSSFIALLPGRFEFGWCLVICLSGRAEERGWDGVEFELKKKNINFLGQSQLRGWLQWGFPCLFCLIAAFLVSFYHFLPELDFFFLTILRTTPLLPFTSFSFFSSHVSVIWFQTVQGCQLGGRRSCVTAVTLTSMSTNVRLAFLTSLRSLRFTVGHDFVVALFFYP